MATFTSQPPLEKCKCQGEIESIKADAKAHQSSLNSSFTNKKTKRTDKTPKRAEGSLTDQALRPKNLTKGKTK